MPKLKLLYLGLGFLVFVLNIKVSISQCNVSNTLKPKDIQQCPILDFSNTLERKFLGCGFSKKIKVTNQKNYPLKNHILTTNIGLIVLDSLGRMKTFTIKQCQKDSLEISCIGFDKKRIGFDELKDLDIIVLKEKVELLEEVKVSSVETRTIRCGLRCVFSRSSIHKSDTLLKYKQPNNLEKFQFSIFPNPAKANQNLNLKINDTGNYWLQYINIKGQIIAQQNICVQFKNQLISVQAPTVYAAQMVVLQLINKQTSTKIVQSILLIP